MSGLTSAQSGFVLTGRHVLLGMLGFFAAVILVNAGFIVMAMRTFPGEDVPRSYTQGLAYNDTLAARRAQAALGWRAEVALEREEGGRAALAVRLRDRTGAPLSGAELSGELRRLATAAGDRPLRFVALGGGVYRAELGALAPGGWSLRLSARRGEHALELERRLQWPVST